MRVARRRPLLRRFAWRMGRALYRWARLESANDPRTNGEYWLIDRVAALAGGPAVFIDIGANRGDWTEQAARCVGRWQQGLVMAFEPCSGTFESLRARFAAQSEVRPRRCAISDREAEVELFVVAPMAGTNSLYRTPGAVAETVRAARLDDVMRDEGIVQIALVKSDTEGHDFKAIRGAEAALARGAIDVWQFEYNHRWIDAGASLKDVFRFVHDKPYVVGKLYGNGIEIYSEWHPELDRFFETNYVLVRKGAAIERICSPTRFDGSNVAMPARE